MDCMKEGYLLNHIDAIPFMVYKLGKQDLK